MPLVPAAILFDLANGGDKDWGDAPPYARLGAEALAASGADFALGSAGAGLGATTANLKGGLGSASTRLEDGTTVGALVAVNALGQATIGDSPHFWAAPFEAGTEFGGLGWPAADAARGDAAPPQGSVQGGREHDDRRRRHRRDAHQGRVQTAGDHGP